MFDPKKDQWINGAKGSKSKRSEDTAMLRNYKAGGSKEQRNSEYHLE